MNAFRETIPKVLPAVAVLLLAAPPAGGQSEVSADDPAVRAQIAVIDGWAREREIVEAVKAQNSKGTSLEEIQRLDARWVAGEAETEVQALLGNPCAKRLASLLENDAAYREALVLDDQGALVCISDRTSDYWQGDEAKWQRSFDGGAGKPFVDRARYDTSARAILVQISVPIRDGESTIGVVTVGIDRAKFGQ
jgi:hypothetical protein